MCIAAHVMQNDNELQDIDVIARVTQEIEDFGQRILTQQFLGWWSINDFSVIVGFGISIATGGGIDWEFWDVGAIWAFTGDITFDEYWNDAFGQIFVIAISMRQEVVHQNLTQLKTLATRQSQHLKADHVQIPVTLYIADFEISQTIINTLIIFFWKLYEISRSTEL